MDERWQKVERIYYAALGLEGDAREEYLAKACAGDPALRAELDSLLGHASKATSSPETPPVEVVAEPPGKDESSPDPRTATVEIGGMVAHYRLTEKLGEGGMGEVYSARDTKWQRDVALKILPQALARDAQRMARFERQAQVLASLNHPNIAAIHGLEESNGIRALVMELVKGQTLAEKIAAEGSARPRQRGALPYQDALPIARQIADALEYAYERGVIHRDLKPANVKITPEGTVKVLDFGLAEVMSPQDSSAALDPANSRTPSAMATKAGMTLGTAAYMSPEQAKRQLVDRRCDIWAFGCMLYEMLTGRKPFGGETISDVLAAVITKEPDWDALPATIPQSIQKLIHRCLQKDLRQRLQAIGEARITIEEALSGDAGVRPAPVPAEVAPVQPKWSLLRRAVPWAVAGVFAAIAFFAAFAPRKKVAPPPPPPPKPPVVASILPPPNTTFRPFGLGAGPVVISPDGRQLAFSAADKKGDTSLYVRSLASAEVMSFAGLAIMKDAEMPFWSPDGSSLGFFADGKLKKVNLASGSVQILADGMCSELGGAWSPNGTILFTPRCNAPLEKIPSSGGNPSPAASLESGAHEQGLPAFLPDGRHFLYVSGPDFWHTSIWMGSLDSSRQKLVLKGASHPEFASGHLLFFRTGKVFAQPFDPATGKLTGKASAIAGGWNYSVSGSGVLAYQDGTPFGRLEWVDRSGNPLGKVGSVAIYTAARISPNGKRVLADIHDLQSGSEDLWSFPAKGGRGTRLTFGPGRKAFSVWSPDGKHIAFSCQSNDKQGVCLKRANGSRTETRLLSIGTGILNLDVSDWSPDSRYLSFNEYVSKDSRREDWILPLIGGHKPFQPTTGNASQLGALFSPDGHWFAYVSYQTGRPEVYVAPFPWRGSEFKISQNGGWDPRWDKKGHLYFLSMDNRLMEANLVTRRKSVQVKSLNPLFQLSLPSLADPLFDVSADGNRFLVVTSNIPNASRSIGLLLNWQSKLKDKD